MVVEDIDIITKYLEDVQENDLEIKKKTRGICYL